MPRCAVCDNEDFSPAPEFNKDLLRCNRCNLIFYRDIDNISPSSIYHDKYFQGRYYNYILDKAVLQKNFRKRLDIIKKFSKKGKLLEIGTAYGFFLELAVKDFEVFGIDIAECGIQYAKNTLGLFNVFCQEYLNIRFKDSYFDVICLFDTIEHLREPHHYLEKSSVELKTGGTIFLTTGDIDSLAAKIQRHNWRLINIPTHLYYFSFSTLKKLLEKYGFEVIYKTYPGYYRSLAQMIYLAFLKNKNAITESYAFKIMEKIPVYLNLYDIMFVAARKL